AVQVGGQWWEEIDREASRLTSWSDLTSRELRVVVAHDDNPRTAGCGTELIGRRSAEGREHVTAEQLDGVQGIGPEGRTEGEVTDAGPDQQVQSLDQGFGRAPHADLEHPVGHEAG